MTTPTEGRMLKVADEPIEFSDSSPDESKVDLSATMRQIARRPLLFQHVRPKRCRRKGNPRKQPR